MPGDSRPDPEYVAARRVLLDALGALGGHRDSVVLVGAQAIYLHVGESDLAVAPYTTDADLVIDPRELADEPKLVKALTSGGFELAVRPGSWVRSAVQVDFMVPDALGGPGRRGARLGPHGNDIARKTAGLEAAVVNCELVQIASFENGDDRAFDVKVAGLAALLIAKLYKIDERKEAVERRYDKDGLDVLRMLRFASTPELAAKLNELSADSMAGEVAQRARAMLDELFGRRGATGVQMAVRATAGLEDATPIELSCEVLASRLLEAWR